MYVRRPALPPEKDPMQKEANELGEKLVKLLINTKSKDQDTLYPRVYNLISTYNLISGGADIEYRYYDNHLINGHTPLIISTRKGFYYVFQKLLEYRANVNAKSDCGTTALHWAAKLGHVQMVRDLICHGAQVNCWNNEGNAPLHLAAMGGDDAEIIEILLAAGAKKDMVNHEGKTPYDLAKQYGNLKRKGVRLLKLYKQEATPQVIIQEEPTVKDVTEADIQNEIMMLRKKLKEL